MRRRWSLTVSLEIWKRSARSPQVCLLSFFMTAFRAASFSTCGRNERGSPQIEIFRSGILETMFDGTFTHSIIPKFYSATWYGEANLKVMRQTTPNELLRYHYLSSPMLQLPLICLWHAHLYWPRAMNPRTSLRAFLARLELISLSLVNSSYKR